MNDKLNDAMKEIRDEFIADAGQSKQRRKGYWFSAAAAVLALVILIAGIAGIYPPRSTQASSGEDPTSPPTVQGTAPNVPNPSGIPSPGDLKLANLLACPTYPQMLARPNWDDYADYQEYRAMMEAFTENQAAQYDQPDGYADSLTSFFLESIRQFLDPNANSAYSPVNVYMALAMLAETTNGNSRQQILDVLGLDSIEALRRQVNHMWNAHFADDGVTTLLLGSSMWLDEAYSFRQETIDILAKNYYASSFRGNLGTEDMNRQLRDWLNAHTGGLLQEQAENVELDPSTVFALATTVYFAAGWGSEFSQENTQDMVFHCDEYDLLTPFMRNTFREHTYYWADNFSAISLPLSGENHMWLILPDEGYTVADILESDDYLRLTMDPGSWLHQSTYKINLSLPKFDVVSETDLTTGLKAMGITDVFNPIISDFSPLTDTPNLFVSSATHAARVTIDEEGVLAAAFTVFFFGTTAVQPQYQEIDFTLDRPFLFVISSRDDLPLFAGVVNEP